jgi:hypothetical protein
MYKEKEKHDLEDMYVLGHRILRFLTVYLPRHPDFSKPRSWNLRNKSRGEIKTLEFCLEDIAVLIDEQHCNQVVDFAPEFDMFLLEDQGSRIYGDSTEPTKLSDDSPNDNWVPFGGWQGDEKALIADSPDTTLSTTGSESVEPLDISSSEAGDLHTELQIDFSDNMDSYEEDDEEVEQGQIMFTLDFSESSEEDEFLYRIANEHVPFYMDSDASDSWAQDNQSNPSFVAYRRSRNAPTCDPAEIAFRHSMSPASDKIKTYQRNQSPLSTMKQVSEVIAQSDNARTTFDPETERHSDLIASVVDEEPSMVFEDNYRVSRIIQKGLDSTKPVVQSAKISFQAFNPDLLDIDEWISFDNDENKATKPFDF